MKLTFDKSSMEVQREPSDQKANTEAHFWFLLRNQLNGMKTAPMTSIGKRWRRVRPDKTDGCLTGMPFALAVGRKWDRLISDGMYAVRGAREEYNKGEVVRLDYQG